MKIQFLGSGSAFVLGKENYQSNIIISDDEDNRLLYDCGTTIPDALDAQGLTPQDIESVYISHLHGDHAGGIEYMAFKTYFETWNYNKEGFGSMKPKLFAHKSILFNGWDNTWKGGLQSIQGQVNSLESYFETKYMESNDEFYHHKIKVEPIQTVHVVDDRMINPSYGVMLQETKETHEGNIYTERVFITGDSQFAPNQMLTYFKIADAIFHDCEFADYPNSVHAQFHQLKTLTPEVKAKMYLYHYMLKDKTFEELEAEVLEAGFAGLVKRGDTFEYNEFI